MKKRLFNGLYDIESGAGEGDYKICNQDCVALFSVSDEVGDFGDFLRKKTDEFCENTRQQEVCQDSGSTFCGAMVRKSEGAFDITVGNLGDSRAMLVMRNKKGREILVSLSEDFDPDTFRIKQKVWQNGGRISPDAFGVLRVGGILAVAGGVGDLNVKGVIRTPDIIAHRANRDHVGDTEFKGFDPVGLLVVSDAFSKMGDVFAARDLDVYDLVLGVKDLSRFYFKQSCVNVDFGGEVTASSFSNYIEMRAGKRDDNSAVFVNFDTMNNGQSLMAVVADGHGDNGHEVSAQIIEELGRENCLNLIDYKSHVIESCSERKDKFEISRVALQPVIREETRSFWDKIGAKFACCCRRSRQDEAPATDVAVCDAVAVRDGQEALRTSVV